MNTETPSVKSAKSVDFSPKVSVIVPVYKVEKYLPECIESILAQTFPDFELILVDDGSPDNSGAICDDYAVRDSRIRVFHKENGGVSSARNLGLDNARGEWVAFVDSDDTVGEHYLEVLFNCSKKATSIGMIFFLFGTDKEELRSKKASPFYSDKFSGSRIYELWERDVLGYAVTKILRREFIEREKIRFSEELSLCEDLIFALDCLRAVRDADSDIAFLEEKLYFYRRQEGVRHGDSFALQNRITELFQNRINALLSPDEPFSKKMRFGRAHRAFVAGFIAEFIAAKKFPAFEEIRTSIVWKELMTASQKDVLSVLNRKWALLFALRVLPEKLFFKVICLKIYQNVICQ